MTYKVTLSAEALSDLNRLPDFVVISSPNAAARVRRVLLNALASLTEMPHRGRLTADPRVRDLPVAFGRYGYVISYSVREDAVFITRIRHARERR